MISVCYILTFDAVCTFDKDDNREWEFLLKCSCREAYETDSTWIWFYLKYQVLQLLNVLDYVCKLQYFLPTTQLHLVFVEQTI